MRLLKDMSIKNKLRLIILATSGVVLLLASIGSVTNELYVMRRNMTTDLSTLAEVVGLNSGAGLLFKDRKAVRETLAGLKAKPRIMLAHVFDMQGGIFASYQRDGVLPPPYKNLSEYYFAGNSEEAVPEDRVFFRDNYLEVFKQIVFENEVVGTIYIRTDLDEFWDSLRWAARVVLLILLAALFLAFLLASRFQRLITEPLDSLLNTMRAVSMYKDYGIRETKTSNDELGSLVEGFNDMLEQIETQTEQLHQYHNHLEELVGQRTVELAEARDQALAANRAKSIFLANMSHEIRTPMNAVLGYAQILQRDSVLTAEQRRTLQIIENSGNHLLELINDILDISKIEAGAMEVRAEDFFLAELVEGISAMFQIRCEQKKLNWGLEYDLSDDLMVHSDQGKLRQILINLLGNAVKFTDKGDVILRVANGPQPDWYLLEVIDTGPGIGLEDQKKIFEPFQQEQSGQEKGGTGLGLAITQRQVELMGGHIEVQSERGKGSCFRVFMPMPKGEGMVSRHAERTEVSRLAQGYQVSALVVDDVEENRDILSHMLAEIGVSVRQAIHGQDALDKMEENLPDIVFMDIRMPVMDGMAAIRHIRQMFAGRRVSCIAISASTLRHQTQGMLDAGFDDFISKPFRFSAIYDCLEKFLHVEFEYKQAPAEGETADSGKPQALDVSQCCLPDALYHRLREAAELNDLTEMENLLEEMRQTGDETLHRLAEHFAGLLLNYDVDGILSALENVTHAESC